MAAGHNNVILETKSLTSFTCTAQAASEETKLYMMQYEESLLCSTHRFSIENNCHLMPGCLHEYSMSLFLIFFLNYYFILTSSISNTVLLAFCLFSFSVSPWDLGNAVTAHPSHGTDSHPALSLVGHPLCSLPAPWSPTFHLTFSSALLLLPLTLRQQHKN